MSNRGEKSPPNPSLFRSGRQQSLRRRLLALLAAVLLATLLIIGAGVYYFVFLTEREAWQGRQEEAARNAVQTVVTFIQRIEDSLTLVSLLDRDYLAAEPQVMRDLLQQNPALLEMVRLDASGKVFASAYQDTPLLANLFTIPQSTWFLQATASEYYLGDIQISPAGDPYLVVAVPAPDGGVVAARLCMGMLRDVVAAIRFGETGQAYVINREGRMVAHTRSEVVMAKTSLAGRPEAVALSQSPGHKWNGAYVNFEGTPVVGTTAPVPGTGWMVITELAQSEAFAVSRTALLVLSGGMLLFGVPVMWVTACFLRRLIFQPMERLRVGAERIGQGDLRHRINIARQDEVGRVAEAFNEMAGRLRDREDQLAVRTAALATEVAERKRVEEEIKRRGDELEALREISLAVTAQLELDEVLRSVVERGCRLLDAEAGGVYLVDEERGDLELVVSWGYTRDYTGARLSPGEGLAGKVLQSGASLAVDAYHNWEERSPDWEAEPLTAVLGVPLKRGEHVIGVLSFAEMAQAGGFDEHDVWLSMLFANQVAIAIENARLYQAEQHGREVAEVLRETARVVNASLNLDEVLSIILEQLAQVIHYDSSTVLLLGDGRFKVTAGRGFPDMEGTLRLSFSADEDSLSSAVVRARRPLIIEDVQDDPRWQPGPATAHIHGWIGAPLIVRDRAIGVLAVDSCRPGTYSEEDGHLVSTFANQAAVAIENARLFTETSRRVRELRLLHDVGLAASSGVRLEETLQAAAVALAAELEGNNVALLLLDPESSTLRMAASVGYPTDVVKDLRLRLDEGVTGWVAQHGESLLVSDVRLDHRYVEVASSTRSELCVPLAAGPLVIGVINVESAQSDAFTDDDQRLLSTLASNLTVLIERARLFEEMEAARMALQQRAEALEEANVRLRELDRLKSEFLANMSHELRTPLNSVIGFSEVLIDGLVGEVSSEQKECLGNIRSSGKDLLALINDILDLSKIEAGRVELKMATFDVAGLLAEVEVTIRPLVEKKSQVLKIEQAGGLPPLTADRFRVKQVLLNLLSNAHKFTLVEGHITLCCRLVDQATMLFSVTDTGIGIKPEDQRIIFEEFRQADGSAAREITGTGLGLAISKRLVEMHGGRIWVESEYGHGATFSLLLPLAGPPAAGPGVAGETELSLFTTEPMLGEPSGLAGPVVACQRRWPRGEGEEVLL